MDEIDNTKDVLEKRNMIIGLYIKASQLKNNPQEQKKFIEKHKKYFKFA